jgi:hypothetical protein
LGRAYVLYAAFDEFSAKNRTAITALVFIGWPCRVGQLLCGRYDVAIGQRTGKNPRCFNRAKYNISPANDPAGD